MKGRVCFIGLFAAIILIAIFMINSKVNDYRKLGGDFLAAIGLQNTASSQYAASPATNNVLVATSTPTLSDILQQFQDQMQSLNSQMAHLRSEIEVLNLRNVFTRTLRRGDAGDDVRKLQELLTRFPELYSSQDSDISSTVTGFYGSFTKAAIAQFQSQTGLPETGIFGTSTREKFYESLSNSAQESTSTEFVPIDVSSIGGQNNFDVQTSIANLQDQVSRLASDSTITQANVADLQNQVSQLSSDLANANEEVANLQNQLSAQPSLPPPTPAPSLPLAISNIQSTNISKTSSTIMWTTNVPSTSEVDYSTDSNLPANKITVVNNVNMVTNHAMTLQNLNSGTKYYYLILSRDNTNVTVSSTIQSFSTLH